MILLVFPNRQQAGLHLADKLQEFKNRKDTIVLSIPRGGVVVGKQISIRLNIPLSAIVVKKLGAPGNPELAIGAIAPDGVTYIDFDLALRSGVEQEYLDKEIKEKRKEIEEREKKFRIKNLELRIEDKKIIFLVDDGIATGATTLAALKFIKNIKKGVILSGAKNPVGNSVNVWDPSPAKRDQDDTCILAVPVIAKDTYNKLKSEVDKIVALKIPESFNAVGQFYREFPQVSDEEVIKLLK